MVPNGASNISSFNYESKVNYMKQSFTKYVDNAATYTISINKIIDAFGDFDRYDMYTAEDVNMVRKAVNELYGRVNVDYSGFSTVFKFTDKDFGKLFNIK
jgi:hypothetical protein